MTQHQSEILTGEIIECERSYAEALVRQIMNSPHPSLEKDYVEAILELAKKCLDEGTELADFIQTGTIQPLLDGEDESRLPVREMLINNAYLDGWKDGVNAASEIAYEELAESDIDENSNVAVMSAFLLGLEYSDKI